MRFLPFILFFLWIINSFLYKKVLVWLIIYYIIVWKSYFLFFRGIRNDVFISLKIIFISLIIHLMNKIIIAFCFIKNIFFRWIIDFGLTVENFFLILIKKIFFWNQWFLNRTAQTNLIIKSCLNILFFFEFDKFGI